MSKEKSQLSENFSKSLKDKRLELRLSQEKMGKLLGISKNYVWMLEKGMHNPTLPIVEAFKAIAPEIEIESKTTETIGIPGDRTNVRPAPAIKTRRVPVVSWAMASAYFDHVAGNFGDLEVQIDEYLDVHTNDENAYALIVEGPSMEPYVLAGSWIVASPNQEARNGDLVVARLQQTGEVRFKRIKYLPPEGKMIRLESLNTGFAPIDYPAEAFRLIHPVIECRMNPRAVHLNAIN